MNRNVESHFSQLPNAQIQRSQFDRSSTHKSSGNVGDCIPVYVDEVLPGDTFNVKTSKVIRLQTLLTPVMDNAYADFYWFFCPNRILWTHWQSFCGENTESAWAPETEYTVPKISAPEGGFATGTIADYLGLPVYTTIANGRHMPSALPFRAYAKIMQEFFRDENLTDPLNIPDGDANQSGSNGGDYINDVANGGKPFVAARFHDYFSSTLPQPQKGESPTIEITGEIAGGDFPVFTKADNIDINKFYPSFADRSSLSFIGNMNRASGPDADVISKDLTTTGWVYPSNTTISTADSVIGAGSNTYTRLAPVNLWTQIPTTKVGGDAININDLRLAFATQKFLERSARGGSRYVELLKSHFGVTSPDARLQRPEYLGGNRVPLTVHSVTATAQSETDFLGDVGAMSVTSDVHNDFIKSFTEHGILMCIMVVRYDHTYTQGLERFWMRDKFLDFFLPVFSNIGEQPVFRDELFYDESTPETEDVFGYQEAWADYRYKPNRCSGEMRPGIPNSLASWHYADYYESAPVLSDEWIREDKSNVDRTLAVSSDLANQFFFDIYFNAVVTRPMPMYSVPGLIDHN